MIRGFGMDALCECNMCLRVHKSLKSQESKEKKKILNTFLDPHIAQEPELYP